MIQRIQSLWLFLAGIFCAGTLYFDLYKWQFDATTSISPKLLRVNDNYMSLLIVLISTILPLVAIFMFKNRKKQKRISIISIIINLLFIGTILLREQMEKPLKPMPISGTYMIGSLLPAFSIVFLFLAISGINKDEKLVKSIDRLR